MRLFSAPTKLHVCPCAVPLHWAQTGRRKLDLRKLPLPGEHCVTAVEGTPLHNVDLGGSKALNSDDEAPSHLAKVEGK